MTYENKVYEAQSQGVLASLAKTTASKDDEMIYQMPYFSLIAFLLTFHSLFLRTFKAPQNMFLITLNPGIMAFYIDH